MTPARARAIAEYIALGSVEQEVRTALIAYADMVERCEKIVGECVPLLDEIFMRYGCDGTRCCHWSCPNGSPCYASIVRNVANELRKLRGDAGEGGTQ